MKTELQELKDFLHCPTPSAWLERASENIPVLLIDHAHCERKAAHTALNLIAIAPDKPSLIALMSPLAREEMLHFEKVLDIIAARNISFTNLAPSNYALTLHKLTYKKDKEKRLLDLLLIGAIIEARSCERFDALIPVLEDEKLCHFYRSLVKAEARHFREYLALAQDISSNYQERLDQFLEAEADYLNTPDKVFRFHSGLPV